MVELVSMTPPPDSIFGQFPQEEAEPRFHHHEERHKHRYYSSLHGKDRFRRVAYRSYPELEFLDYFPVKANVYKSPDFYGKAAQKLTPAEKRQSPEARQLVNNLKWVRGTLVAFGAKPKVIRAMRELTHTIGDPQITSQLLYGQPVYGSSDQGASDLNLVGNLVTQGVLNYITPAKNTAEADRIREAFAQIVGEVSKQRKIGQCSGSADWSDLDDSNPVGRVFKIFAQKLDHEAVWGDQFSWDVPGRVWYKAMTGLSENPTLFEFKLLTLEAARSLYPFNQQLRFALKEAWNQVEAQVQNEWTLNGQSVKSIKVSRYMGFTGLTEVKIISPQTLSESAKNWLAGLSSEPIARPKGAADLEEASVTFVLEDGSEVVRHYDPQQVHEEFQSVIDDSQDWSTGTINTD